MHLQIYEKVNRRWYHNLFLNPHYSATSNLCIRVTVRARIYHRRGCECQLFHPYLHTQNIVKRACNSKPEVRKNVLLRRNISHLVLGQIARSRQFSHCQNIEAFSEESSLNLDWLPVSCYLKVTSAVFRPLYMVEKEFTS